MPARFPAATEREPAQAVSCVAERGRWRCQLARRRRASEWFGGVRGQDMLGLPPAPLVIPTYVFRMVTQPLEQVSFAFLP